MPAMWPATGRHFALAGPRQNRRRRRRGARPRRCGSGRMAAPYRGLAAITGAGCAGRSKGVIRREGASEALLISLLLARSWIWRQKELERGHGAGIAVAPSNLIQHMV